MIETSGVSKPVAETFLNPFNAVFDEAHQAATRDSDETHFVTDLKALDVPFSWEYQLNSRRLKVVTSSPLTGLGHIGMP